MHSATTFAVARLKVVRGRRKKWRKILRFPPKPNHRSKRAVGILPDHKIRDFANQGMIEPFVEAQKREGMISYGLSSYGYDARALQPSYSELLDAGFIQAGNK